MISIAMATYNGAAYLEEQLDSLARQTLRPDELVITDDASHDDTLAIAEHFKAFPVHIHRNEKRLGFNGNFAKALSLCRGDIVLPCDQDDIWDPGKVERLSSVLADHPETLAVLHDERILDNGKITGTIFGNVRRLGFNNRDLVSGNCTALRQSFLELLIPFPTGINYDYWIGWTADVLGVRLIVDDVLQTYRRHESNASSPIVATEAEGGIRQRLNAGDPRPLWRENENNLRLIAERLRFKRPEFVALVGEGHVAEALASIKAERVALKRRTEIVSAPRPLRLPRVLGGLASGVYSNFSGVKSAAKDLLLPSF